MTSSTIVIEDAEDRRIWKALTRCAPAAGKASRPVLENIMFDGTRAWATDSYVLGHLHAPFELPLRDGPDGPDRYPVLLPADLLRDALGLVKDKTLCRLRFETGGAVLVIGEDALPLGAEFDTPSVQLPYGHNTEKYPASLALHRMAFPPDPAPDEGFTVGVNAKNLARVAAIVWGGEHMVTVHTATKGLLQVRDATGGQPVGAVALLRTGVPELQATDDEQEAA